ncbi:hypothetical protein QLL95_gp0937 [Cotonvirus japonicus]|uniref:Uncharacterized protein n=1 Tax=Cotonvirus japonicus TaxID=2811091 RepID=A0ABM7NSU2_9VIRU|nr:hypothetical protein QLL95_gp0937 [Cotonvirus japonicus]BCS83186.1 hypothetical protein [Cotonvirus japonicus]
MDLSKKENIFKKIEENLKTIEIIQINSRNIKTFNSKVEQYNSSVIINETKKLIEILLKELDNFELPLGSPKNDKLDEFINLLSIPNLKFTETLDLLKELLLIDNSLPNKTTIKDNVQDDIIYKKN